MADGSLINTFLSLMAMVAVFGVILIIVKRFALKGKNMNNGAAVQIISKTVIQPKTCIYIIKAGNRKLLIGATEHNISTLADLTEDIQTQTQSNTAKSLQQKAIQNKSGNQNITANAAKDLSFGAFLKTAFKRNPN